jgi:hypothetical protein
MLRDYAEQSLEQERAASAIVSFVYDAGHGWLCVDSRECPEALRFASRYSYIGDGVVFLEEDDDAPKFIEEFDIAYAMKSIDNVNLDNESGFELRCLPRGEAN